MVQNIEAIDYPEAGITILEDSRGKFLALKERDEIIDLKIPPDEIAWPRSWKNPVEVPVHS